MEEIKRNPLYWWHSRGCMAEYGYAKAKGIRIYEYVDGTLYPLE
jgi:hypothetical protein|nr:MAG TPA: protein of unknown function (DUF1937) [Caudoviricetes sp.]